MNDVNVAIETTEAAKPAGADIVELTVEQLGEVGGGVAYVFL
jgi:isopropylmalate/homocitrate/citramalate synthase